MESMKYELSQEKVNHSSTQAKYALLLAKATKWESEAIDKLEKLKKVMFELNDYEIHITKLEDDKEKAKANLKPSNCKVAEIDDKAKRELGAMVEQLTFSI